MQRVSLKPFLSRPLPSMAWALFVVCLASVSLVLPVAFRGKYASPDETAVAVVAERIASRQSPRIAEPLAVSYPWLHPRSWASQGTALVPVGFLGWPLLLSPFVLLSSAVLPWIAWVWFVSGLYPFYRLLRQVFAPLEAGIGTLIMAATPMVLLYANRALFPNPAVLSAFLWSLWMLDMSRRRVDYSFLAGIFMGVAMIIRPIEVVWMLPWWIWKLSTLPRTKKQILPVFVAALAVAAVFLASNYFVYGQAWKVGYWIRDNVPMNINRVQSNPSRSLRDIFPFGFHPRVIWWNLRSFTIEFLWPVFCILGSALLTYMLPFKSFSHLWERIRASVFLWLVSWTFFTLLLLYGSGIYQDHVQPGAITVGNSFLRYMLPLAPLAGFAAAYLLDAHKRRRFFVGIASVLVIVFCGFGVYAVTSKDDEGVFATRREIMRYAYIHEEALKVFPEGSIIISDRSDKVFSPSFRTVSPQPSLEEIGRLLRDPQVQLQIGIFARPFSQRQRDDFRRVGVDVLEVGTFGRERLYRLVAR